MRDLFVTNHLHRFVVTSIAAVQLDGVDDVLIQRLVSATPHDCLHHAVGKRALEVNLRQALLGVVCGGDARVPMIVDVVHNLVPNDVAAKLQVQVEGMAGAVDVEGRGEVEIAILVERILQLELQGLADAVVVDPLDDNLRGTLVDRFWYDQLVCRRRISALVEMRSARRLIDVNVVLLRVDDAANGLGQKRSDWLGGEPANVYLGAVVVECVHIHRSRWRLGTRGF